MTSEKYLQLLEDNFSDIQSLVDVYHPFYRVKHKQKITAVGAEALCELEREKIRKKKQPDLYEAYQEKNCIEINHICNDTWWGIPESVACRYERGFGVLCDLCSEFPDDIGVAHEED